MRNLIETKKSQGHKPHHANLEQLKIDVRDILANSHTKIEAVEKIRVAVTRNLNCDCSVDVHWGDARRMDKRHAVILPKGWHETIEVFL